MSKKKNVFQSVKALMEHLVEEAQEMRDASTEEERLYEFIDVIGVIGLLCEKMNFTQQDLERVVTAWDVVNTKKRRRKAINFYVLERIITSISRKRPAKGLSRWECRKTLPSELWN